jgi:uncharacterized protein (DUF1786 family)
MSSSHEQPRIGAHSIRVLAIDVGAGTQDILVFDGARTPENSFKLVLPSQTQIVASRIRAVTRARRPLHLTGRLMGGGASTEAITAHVAAGLHVTALPGPAGTVHNNPVRVVATGVEIVDGAPPDAVRIELGDVDMTAISRALNEFEVDAPEIVAVAVQDHGYRPGRGNNDVRFEFLQRMIDCGGGLSDLIFRDPPPYMTRMEAVADAVPGVYLMDTGAAAVLGALGDPTVARAVSGNGAILVNVGNMHTFATLVQGDRLFGLFEHHTGGMTVEIARDLVDRLQRGALDGATFRAEFDGHGAAIHPEYHDHGPFDFVAITGPNRGRLRGLGFHEAAPHGDMMLTGSFGLVEGVLRKTAEDGNPTGISLTAS